MRRLNTKMIAAAGPGRHGDGDGLYLFVKESGRKTWVLRLQWQGKRHDIGLGTVNEENKSATDQLAHVPILERRYLRLAEAREKASVLRAFARAGRNPLIERDRGRQQIPTFSVAMEKTHKALSPGWSTKSAASFLTSLETHACPMIGRLTVDQVSAKDIQRVLGPIWTAKPEQARKIRHRINQVLNYSHSQGWRSSEAPTKSVTTGLARQPKGGNFAAMPYVELPAFLAAVSAAAPTGGRQALIFLVLTASRSGEVRQARWGQINWEKKEWNCPAEIMKGREAHTVTLSDQAIELLERLRMSRAKIEKTDLVFPGRGGALMSDMTLQRIMRRANCGYDPHGFRSSFRDWAAEMMAAVPDSVAEAALAHAVEDKIVRAYKRTKFLEMRRSLLQSWGDFAFKEIEK